MAGHHRPGKDEDDDGTDNGPDTDGPGWDQGMQPPWGMMPPWAMMGFPLGPPFGPHMGPPMGSWAPPPAAWSPPPWMAPFGPMPLTASLQACDALLHWMASRADLWQHLFTSYAEATANAARTGRTLWDREFGTQWPRSPEFLQGLAAALGSLPPEQAWRVYYDVLSLHALDAARRSRPFAETGKDAGGEVDIDKLRESLRDLPEHHRDQVIWAVRAGQEWRRRARTGSRTDTGYDR